MNERVWEFLKHKQDHDPILGALQLCCPHLAIFSGEDERVPVPGSIHLFSTTACNPHRHRWAALTIKVFPSASHRMQTDAGTRLAPNYPDTLTRWIKARTAINPDP